MENEKSANNAAYAYSVNLLRMLLKMDLISEDEYARITAISADHYGVELYCV